MSLSLCMIVKNEQDVISRCLDSVKNIFDEIIIVDTGSTDNTKDIAKKYTNKIYDFKWCQDFSKARNFSFSKATSDYIMWLDADDILQENDKTELLKLKESLDNTIDFVMMKYNVSFDEDGNTTMSYYRERIIKNFKEYKWLGKVHEVVAPTGNIIYSDIAITHKKLNPSPTDRNLKIYEKMIKENIKFNARETFYYARELYYNKKYKKAIKVFNEFLNSKDGWIENKINACIDLANSYFAIGKNKEGFLSLIQSFEFDTPRAEVCNEIGKYFLNRFEYEKAIFWYKLSTTISPNIQNGGFVIIDAYNYIPYLNLCVCYNRIGDIKLSYHYNELAGKVKPKDKIYLNNKKYFQNIPNLITI